MVDALNGQAVVHRDHDGATASADLSRGRVRLRHVEITGDPAAPVTPNEQRAGGPAGPGTSPGDAGRRSRTVTPIPETMRIMPRASRPVSVSPSTSQPIRAVSSGASDIISDEIRGPIST